MNRWPVGNTRRDNYEVASVWLGENHRLRRSIKRLSDEIRRGNGNRPGVHAQRNVLIRNGARIPV